MAQKYQVIARKFRPQAFRDVVGQEAAVTTLKNAIRFDKVAHAYLFCGCRGVGKTTLARLFAKTLNCQSPTTDLEPCNTCPSCTEITSGQSLDVIEIDGASNRGIDDIRQINETIGYAPSHGKYKIYIIDEVHMLTKEAFNALLKTLEEPPEKAKFFFATTEAHKVLPTIISRCQRFDLSRIKPDLIVSKLQQISENLGRQVEAEALHLVASFSEGSLRDAESLLDQILCFAEGKVTAATVRSSLGLVPNELFATLDEAFANANIRVAFELVEELFQTGKDLGHFLEQLIEHYRRITLCRTLGEKALPPEIAPRYMNAARLYTQPQCLYILDLLLNAETAFQKSAFQRVSLESILLQIIRSKNRIPVEVLVRRLTELEEALKGGPSEDTPLSPTLAQTPVEEPAKEIPGNEVRQPLKKDVETPAETADLSPLPPRIIPDKAPAADSVTPPVTPTPAPILETLPFNQEKKIEGLRSLESQVPLKKEPEPALNSVELPLSALPEIVEKAHTPQAAPRVEKIAPPIVPLKEKAPEPKKETPPMIEELHSEPQKHPSHYDTLMRFAVVELEGSFKNN